MTQPRVVLRPSYADVDWDQVRKAVIDLLAEINPRDLAAAWCNQISVGLPERALRDSHMLLAFSLLRVLKVHPASLEYDIEETLLRLYNVSRDCGFPALANVRILRSRIANALLAAGIFVDGLYEGPMEEGTKPETLSEVPDDSDTAPYRRIRRDEPTN